MLDIRELADADLDRIAASLRTVVPWVYVDERGLRLAEWRAHDMSIRRVEHEAALRIRRAHSAAIAAMKATFRETQDVAKTIATGTRILQPLLVREGRVFMLAALRHGWQRGAAQIRHRRTKAVLKEFDESQHPRDEQGQFTSGGGGGEGSGGGGGESESAVREKLVARVGTAIKWNQPSGRAILARGGKLPDSGPIYMTTDAELAVDYSENGKKELGTYSVNQRSLLVAGSDVWNARFGHLEESPDLFSQPPDEVLDYIKSKKLGGLASTSGQYVRIEDRHAAGMRLHKYWPRQIEKASLPLRPTPDVSLDFDAAYPGIADYVRSRPRLYSPDVTATTMRQFRNAIVRGVDQGLPVSRIAENIFDLELEGIGLTRAQAIARTEAVAAGNRGAFEAYKASGVVEQKQWLNAGDALVRDSHDIDDVVPIDEPFELPSGARLMHPGDGSLGAGPEEIVNCRCSIGPVVEAA